MEIDYKQEMCIKLSSILSERFNVPMREFSNIFYYVANDYEIKTSCTELVVNNNSDFEIIKRFIVCKKIEGLSERSLDLYFYNLKRFYGYINHRKSLLDITANDVRAFLADGMVNKNWSNEYSNNLRLSLSSFYHWCVDEELILRNPISKTKQIKRKKNVREPFTEAEIEKMRDYLSNLKSENGYLKEERAIRDRAIFEVLLSTGCRVAELCGMKVGDIDFKTHEVKVIGKGQKERIVFLNEKSFFYLSRYLESKTEHNDSSDFVFYTLLSGGKSAPLKISGVEIIIRELGRACNIKAFPHKFRHTAATVALRRGMPIDQVRMMLGHESIDTTLIYAQSNMDDVKVNHDKYLQ